MGKHSKRNYRPRNVTFKKRKNYSGGGPNEKRSFFSRLTQPRIGNPFDVSHTQSGSSIQNLPTTAVPESPERPSMISRVKDVFSRTPKAASDANVPNQPYGPAPATRNYGLLTNVLNRQGVQNANNLDQMAYNNTVESAIQNTIANQSEIRIPLDRDVTLLIGDTRLKLINGEIQNSGQQSVAV